MFIAHIEHHHIPKSVPESALIRRIGRALTEAGVDSIPVRIFCDESEYRKRSAVQAAVKKIHGLGLLQSSNLEEDGTLILSNLDASWMECVQSTSSECVAWEDAVRLAEGIPRSYPFNHAYFQFAPIELLTLIDEIPPPSEPRTLSLDDCSNYAPGIYLGSNWWTSGRQKSLTVVVHRPMPSTTAKTVPPLPEKTSALLKAIGKPKRVETRVWMTAKEYAPFYEKGLNAHRIERPDFQLPAQVRQLGYIPGLRYDSTPGSLKDALTKRLKPLGFRYQNRRTFRGSGLFSRRTKHHHEVLVETDWGPSSRVVSAKVHVSGLGLLVSTHLPLGGPIVECPASLDAVSDNILYCVERLEKEWVPQVESAFGSGSSWYKSNFIPHFHRGDWVW